jgi:enoyl-[acyl-carrier-protein] reductase (NADH)
VAAELEPAHLRVDGIFSGPFKTLAGAGIKSFGADACAPGKPRPCAIA